MVETARSYIGCPFHHQGRSRHGIDCVGLLVVCAHSVGASSYDFKTYRRRPDGETLLKELQKGGLVRTEDPKEGDCIVFGIGKRFWPYHVAIRTPTGMIHTWADIGRVVESGYDDYWIKHHHSDWTFAAWQR